MVIYDEIGRTYTSTRRADPAIAAQIDRALGDVSSVVNVGAGTGSYEPPTTVVAIEPSRTMIDQRPAGSAPAVCAVAESIPLEDDAVDAALAVLTVHHWTDLERGIAELKRVARRRVVVLTFDETVTRDFWLLRDYLPAAREYDRAHAVPMERLVAALGPCEVEAVPVPHDCVDGFAAAYWRRPAAYLDPSVRAGMSVLSRIGDAEIRRGLDRLENDIATGVWARTYADLLDLDELDAGYRLVTLDL
ncbi:class I SAM-dependent methyltransferase [Cellulomonas xiejunii]|uniref:Class I SAM-dependent methyltransferase n=1 Tax=Cellulomonas xiejunii TaxID=2968083 RepID=A0ABY5KR06_9CELL|nr:methyltransferase domain-containing protein [Cellulomonas xiejunii]MCC2322171.1 class I SAM-dependent methyltransferase [Cellulomonas xiejunii]MCC2323186.1 class I SAM-dependent methyltransferase [Cellulomonas xiejunii]UUI72225.1 class I SAM-dependent methyltransferase [Cellulomonas xiejunii]